MAGTHRGPTERQNEKTRQKAGFSGCSEILKAFSETLSGSTTWTRTRDPMINSHLLAVSRNGATEERGGDIGLLHSVSRMSAARHES